MLTNGHKPVKKAIIYARCSTDEARQDTETQLAELRRYCAAFGWQFDEVAEYDSGFKGTQPKLQEVLERIRRKEYDALLVYSLDRFSRQAPSRVNRLLDAIVERDGCRFISRQEGIDSDNELVWNAIRPLFSWFAFVYSRNLSEKIKAGIRTKREKGIYKGGRPSKTIDVDRLKRLRLTHRDYGWRRLTEAYNEGLDGRCSVSVSLLRRVCQKLSFNGQHENGAVSRGVETNCFLTREN